MTVDASEHDGIVWECAGERLVSRKLLRRPTVLIPASAQNPLPRRDILRPRFHAIDHFIIRRRSSEIRPLQRVPKAKQVRVGVDDSRDDGGTTQVDDLRTLAGECLGLGVGTDEQDALVSNREGRSDRTGVVNGVNAAVGENEIG